MYRSVRNRRTMVWIKYAVTSEMYDELQKATGKDLRKLNVETNVYKGIPLMFFGTKDSEADDYLVLNVSSGYSTASSKIKVKLDRSLLLKLQSIFPAQITKKKPSLAERALADHEAADKAADKEEVERTAAFVKAPKEIVDFSTGGLTEALTVI